MGTEDDRRVKAAIEVLRSQLQEIFDKTSVDCHDKLAAKFPNLPEATDEGDPMILVREAIGLWREKSLESVAAGFQSLLAITRSWQDETQDNLSDVARDLTWQAIDQAFNWTAEDRNTSGRFKQWHLRVGVEDFWAYGLLMFSPDCNKHSSLADQLNCDFRAVFERLLNRLRYEAFLNASRAQSTNTLVAGVSQAHSVDGKGPAPRPQEQVEPSNFLRFSGNLWAVRFGGGSVSHIDDLVGVQYISLILKQKLSEQNDLAAPELVALRYGQEVTPELESRDEVLPLRDTEIIRERLAEIKAERERASSPGDIDDLLDEKAKLEDYLSGGRVKLSGADRTSRQAIFATQSKKAVDAVRKAIKEATEKMEADKALADLAAHLNSNIRFGTTVSYVGSIAWTVEPGNFPRKKS